MDPKPLELHIGTQVTRKVANLEEASLFWQKYRSEHHMGVRDMPDVYVQDGNRKVARISYNGRCWDPGNAGVELLLKPNKTEVKEGH